MVNTRSARHTASLPLLRTVGVGRNPVALAVDERAGRAFVVGAAGSVTVLDAATGATVRTVAVGRGAQSVAVDEATGRAFVTDPGRVFTLDARTGAVLRASPLGGGIQAGPVIDEAHGEVFVATRGVGRGPAGPGPGSVAVLDATTGRLRRTLPIDADLLAVDGSTRRIVAPYACGDTPGVADMCVIMFDAVTGRQLKGVDLSSQQGYAQQPSAIAVDARAGSAVVLYGDGRGDANIGVVATRTGIRRAPVMGAYGASGVIAIDAAAGRAAIATAPDSYPFGGGYGLLLTASVSVIDTRSGRAVGGANIRTRSGGTTYVPGAAADARRGHFYVVATPSAGPRLSSPRSILAVLDARSGRLLRTVTLPTSMIVPNASHGPAMAVDGHMDRLFITNGNDNSVSILDTTRL